MNAWKVWLHPKRSAREIERLAAELEEARREETAARIEAEQERRFGENISMQRDAFEKDLDACHRKVSELNERLASAVIENDSLKADLATLRKEKTEADEHMAGESQRESERHEREMARLRRRLSDARRAGSFRRRPTSEAGSIDLSEGTENAGIEDWVEDNSEDNELLEAGESPFAAPTPRVTPRPERARPLATPADEFNWLKQLPDSE